MVVRDETEDILKKGMSTIDKVLTRNVEKERITQQDKEATLGRIKATTDYKDLADCDLIVEAIFESMEGFCRSLRQR